MPFKRTRTPEERYWSKVNKRGALWNGSHCWEWSAKRSGGYGQFALTHSKLIYVHRFSWELAHGPIPVELRIDHLCRNTICVNPDHMELVTPKENVLRGDTIPALNARKTHCIHGHPFDVFNTRFWKTRRICRTCAREGMRRLRASH